MAHGFLQSFSSNIEVHSAGTRPASHVNPLAVETMMEAGIRREKRKDYVDMIAATLILQGYLDLRANQSKE
jgi:protein-tyrosine-phosphatase